MCCLLTHAGTFERIGARNFSNLIDSNVEDSSNFIFEVSGDVRLDQQVLGTDCQRGNVPQARGNTDVIFINTDISTLHNGLGVCGGILKDSNGNWFLGFNQRLDPVPPTIAEILGIYKGLK